MQEPVKCPRCDSSMELKAEVEGFGEDGSIVFFQCPSCKNIQVYNRQYEHQLRMDYP